MNPRPFWLGLCAWTFALAGCGGARANEPAKPSLQATPAEAPSSQTQPAETKLAESALAGLDTLLPPVARPDKKPSDVPTDDRAAEQLAKAREFFDRGEHASAALTLERAAGFDPNSPEIRRLLALSYVRLGSLSRAGPHLEAAAQVAGDDAQMQLLLGQYLAAKGEHAAGLLALRRALLCSDAAPDSLVVGETLVLLGEELRKQGYLTASLEAYGRLAENVDKYGDQYYESRALRWLVERPESLLLARGQVLMALNRHAEAADVLDAAYRLNKSDPRTAQLELQALAASRQFDRAEQLVLEILGGSTERPQVEAMVRQLYQASGDAAGPVRLYEQYRQRYGPPSVGLALALAAAAEAVGSPQESMKILAAQAELTPENVDLGAQVARADLAAGRTQQAMERLIGLMEQPDDPGRSGVAVATGIIAELAPKALTDAFVLEYARTARQDASPRKHLLHYLAGLMARRTDKAHLAAEQLEQALSARADFSPAYEVLAEVYARQGRQEQVKALTERARKELGDGRVTFYLLGRASLDAGRLDQAIEELSKAVAADAAHVPSRLLLAKALLRAGRNQEAERTLREGTRLADDKALYEMLGQLYLDQARDELARARISIGDDEAPPAPGAAQSEAAGKSLIQAVGIAQELLRRDPQSPVGLRLMVQAYFMSGRLSAARQGLEELRRHAPDDPQTRLLGIRLETAGAMDRQYIGRRRFEKALAEVQALLAGAPDNREAMIVLADLFSIRKRYAEAAEVLGRLFNQSPSNRAMGLHYAAMLKLADQHAEAAAVLKRMLGDVEAGEDEAVILRLAYADALREAGRADEALTLLDGWLADAPASRAVHYDDGLVSVLVETGKFEQAHELLDRRLARESDTVRMDNLRASKLGVFAEARQFDALEAFADQWLERTGPSLGRPTRLAFGLLAQAEQTDRAIKLARRHLATMQADDDQVGALMAGALRPTLVRVLLALKQRDRARELFEEFLETDAENLDLLLAGQGVYVESQDYEKIVALLQRARKLESSGEIGAMVLNNLGYLWANQGQNLQEAEAIIREAWQIDPAPNVQDSLGWVLYKQGRFAEALENLQAALDNTEGEHAVIYDHIGDAYWRMGDRAKALEMWAEAEDLGEAAVEHLGELIDEDTLRAAQSAPRKIQAVREGGQPPVASVGEGVTVPQ